MKKDFKNQLFDINLEHIEVRFLFDFQRIIF